MSKIQVATVIVQAVTVVVLLVICFLLWDML